MGRKKLRVGSRESHLAVTQARLIMEQIRQCDPDIELELITMKTTGDKVFEQSLQMVGGKGLFVKELEEALWEEEIDIAVHSLKDMAVLMPDDLPIMSFSQREDPRDVLILPKDQPFIANDKPIGCSSLRRMMQLADLKSGLTFAPINGNVLTRINKIDQGQFSALILAYAGMKRLGLEDRVSGVFSIEEILPAAGQGILAVQGRRGEKHSIFNEINDQNAQAAAIAEREFVKTLNGGCSTPIAAFGQVNGNEMKLMGFYVDERSGVKVRGSMTGMRNDGQYLGYKLAKRLLNEVR